MTVSGKLVTVKVCNDIMGGSYILKSIFCTDLDPFKYIFAKVEKWNRDEADTKDF